jgi:DNA polymerase III subunit chi
MIERVDFYLLKSSTAKHRWTFACRLTEKAYLRDLRVVVLSDTASDAEAMDEMLWTFNERSFVPHDLHRNDRSANSAAPVQLTPDLVSIAEADLLVNLSHRLPVGLERFSRIAEIIDADDERRRLGRERFKAYRELKLTMETHQLDDITDA